MGRQSGRGGKKRQVVSCACLPCFVLVLTVRDITISVSIVCVVMGCDGRYIVLGVVWGCFIGSEVKYYRLFGMDG